MGRLFDLLGLGNPMCLEKFYFETLSVVSFCFANIDTKYLLLHDYMRISVCLQSL